MKESGKTISLSRLGAFGAGQIASDQAFQPDNDPACLQRVPLNIAHPVKLDSPRSAPR